MIPLSPSRSVFAEQAATANVVNPAAPGVANVECALKPQLERPSLLRPAMTG